MASEETHSANEKDSGSTQPETQPETQKADSVVEKKQAKGSILVPSWLVYQEGQEYEFGVLLNIVFGVFATFTCMNLYYCQPILGNLAQDFGVDEHRVANIPTLLQAGFALGLLLITPLGDLVRRRPLILLLVLITTGLTVGLAITKSLVVFEVISFLVGIASVVPQVLVPLAADLAPPNRKAGAIAIIWASLWFGILLGRVLSGVITNFVSFRNVYYMATGLQALTLIGAYFIIPDIPAKNIGMTYPQILGSMAKLAVTEPLLIQCSLGISVNNMCFTNLWVTLTFLLLDAPFRYNSLEIGLFGLLGLLGVIVGPFLGRTLDFVVPWYGALFAAFWLLIFQAVMVIGAGLNVAPVIIAVLGIDVFRQMTSVSLTTMAFAIDPKARSRINAVMTFLLFVGQVVGTAASTTVFLNFGWRACYGLALAWTGFQVVLLFWRGPHLPTKSWGGWSGGWRVRKTPPPPPPQAQQP